jgi:ABC-type sugar transport system substrate-binding protein
VKGASVEIASLGMRVGAIVMAGQEIAPQREALADLLESPPAAVALVPAHASAFDDLMERLTLQGTAVVTFNADAPQNLRCSARKSGALAAEVLTKLMGPRGDIVTFPGPLEKGHLAARHGGFLAELGRWRVDARVVARH